MLAINSLEDLKAVMTDFCLTWEDASNKLEELGLFAREDVNATYCKGVLADKELELKVGSSRGHLVRVNLDKGTLEYYDYDSDVNRVMRNLLEDTGAACEVHGGGVKCDIRDADLKKVATVLAAPTSMDFRIREPDYYWIDNENLGALKDKVRDRCGDPYGEDREGFEYCAIKTVLDLE